MAIVDVRVLAGIVEERTERTRPRRNTLARIRSGEHEVPEEISTSDDSVET